MFESVFKCPIYHRQGLLNMTQSLRYMFKHTVFWLVCEQPVRHCFHFVCIKLYINKRVRVIMHSCRTEPFSSRLSSFSFEKKSERISRKFLDLNTDCETNPLPFSGNCLISCLGKGCGGGGFLSDWSFDEGAYQPGRGVGAPTPWTEWQTLNKLPPLIVVGKSVVSFALLMENMEDNVWTSLPGTKRRLWDKPTGKTADLQKSKSSTFIPFHFLFPVRTEPVWPDVYYTHMTHNNTLNHISYKHTWRYHKYINTELCSTKHHRQSETR